MLFEVWTETCDIHGDNYDNNDDDIQCLKQGVRSGIQLVFIETRFQKCSQNGKNGSKHNVIFIYGLQCDFMQKIRKKHSNNQNRLFYYVNSAPDLRNDQKLPKKRISQFFV